MAVVAVWLTTTVTMEEPNHVEIGHPLWCCGDDHLQSEEHDAFWVQRALLPVLPTLTWLLRNSVAVPLLNTFVARDFRAPVGPLHGDLDHYQN